MSIVHRRKSLLSQLRFRYTWEERDELAKRLFGIKGRWLEYKIESGKLTLEEELELMRNIGMTDYVKQIEGSIHEYTQAH